MAENKVKNDIFLKELEIIREKITNYDNFSLIMKGWAITLWSTIIIWYLNNGNNTILCISIIAIISFWFFDALHKFYQRGAAVRDKQIQKNLRDPEFISFLSGKCNAEEDHILYNPTGELSDSEFLRYQNIFRCFLLRQVCVVYLFLISLSFLIMNEIISLIISIAIIVISIILFFVGIDKYFDKFTKWKKLSEKVKIIDVILNPECESLLKSYLKIKQEKKSPKEYLIELLDDKIEEIRIRLKENRGNKSNGST